MQNNNFHWFRKGLRDGIPIALGYLAVGFTLGIQAKNGGIGWFPAGLTALVTVSSTGGFVGFQLMTAGATLAAMALMQLIANARYILMSFALSQKLPQNTSTPKRLMLGMGVTDEIFGICSSVPGTLNIFYPYGAMAVAIPGWTVGTALGAFFGMLLPEFAVSALSVGLYGMFLAVIMPPARKNRVVLVLILLCFLVSWLAGVLPGISSLSSSIRIILLTLILAGGAALLFPVPDAPEEGGCENV